ncbi:MAG TPA: hypothetical protein VGB99_14520 [Acidobacteriota bacterium]
MSTETSEIVIARVGEHLKPEFQYRCQRCHRPVRPEYGWICLPKCPQCSHLRYEAVKRSDA